MKKIGNKWAIRISIGVLIMALLSCTSQNQKLSAKKLDFKNPKLNTDPIEEWIQIEDVVSLDLPDSISLGKIKQIEFTGSEILVLEDGINSSVLIFEKMGSFKRQLLKLGLGPGEYTNIEFFLLTMESLIIYNPGQMKLLAYSLQDLNNFQDYSLHDYYMGGIGGLKNDHIFLVSDTILDEEMTKGYVFLSADLKQILAREQYVGVTDSFLQSSISQFSNQYYLTQPFSDNIYRIENDKLILIYQIDFGSKTTPFLDVAVISDAYEFYDYLKRDSYYFVPTNLLIRDSVIAFNFYNETIDNLNFGLIQNGQAYRFSIDSDLKELLLKPITVRDDLFHTVLLPGEYDEKVIKLLNLTEINYEKPILVSYTIGQ